MWSSHKPNPRRQGGRKQRRRWTESRTTEVDSSADKPVRGWRRFLFHRVNDIPLKYKFLLIYLLCVLLPIIAINSFFYQRNSADIQAREVENLRKSIDRASGELLGMINEGIALNHSIGMDNSIYEALDRSYASPSAYYDEYYGFLRDKLTRYMSANITEVRVYTDNGTIQTGANYYMLSGSTLGNEPWLKQLAQSGSKITVAAYDETSGLNPGKRISIVSKMNTYVSHARYDKYSRVDLAVSKVYDILNRERDSLQLRLVDNQNRVVAASGEDSVQNTAIVPNPPLPEHEDHTGYVVERSLGEFNYVKGWKLIGIADTRRIDNLLNEAHRSILLLAIFSTVIPSLLIFVILRSYHDRVKRLSDHMENIRHERFDRIDMPEGSDEIGELIRTFNVMTMRITTLINDVYKLEIRQKSFELERVRTELSMLQSQVNPHFLFNTLNALLVVCTKNGYTDVTGIIKNLSLMMRQLLSRADGLVLLEEELQFTSMYLQIEKFRFGDLFDYTFDIDPAAMQQRIPRMSIQPLVENACKHGLQARKNDRSIRITAQMDKYGLHVMVSDNGIGMPPERLEQLLQNMKSDEAMEGHIGIRNVYRRLELFYEGEADFMLHSEAGVGTEAGFRIARAELDGEGHFRRRQSG
ncbi:sensor histidine kinase [Paenibacillus campi]|uniref:sensor histidine kinase n=1 Tax=Paenibacillus campi TaxID=3106031 RepID=UPI002AFDEC04|nr:sensor histidine kinase [Paenibacillus sp. SGZ-1009]